LISIGGKVRRKVMGGKIFGLTLLVVGVLMAQVRADAQQDVEKHPSCPFCGMDRGKFAHSRMLVQYEDGTSVGTCSIHCMAIELSLSLDKTPREILVGDYETKELINAEKAFWVLGGDITGVMTQRAKWAFKERQRAETFIKAHGGELADFDQVMRASYEDMYEDTKKIRERRKARAAQHKH